ARACGKAAAVDHIERFGDVRADALPLVHGPDADFREDHRSASCFRAFVAASSFDYRARRAGNKAGTGATELDPRDRIVLRAWESFRDTGVSPVILLETMGETPMPKSMPTLSA